MLNSTEQNLILKLERQRANAVMNQDFETFEKLSHPDLRYIHSTGTVDSLRSYVNSCRKGVYFYKEIRLPVDEIIVTGNTAVVFGRMEASILVDGRPKELDYPSIAVWAREQGRWRFLAFTPRATD